MEKIKNSYPIYELNYRDKLKNVFDALGSFNNLVLAGRTGCFWYNNMDHSIEQAIDIFNKITGEAKNNA